MPSPTHTNPAWCTRHELGLNYNRVMDDLIVGSCLQEAEDVDHLLLEENVKVVYCLQVSMCTACSEEAVPHAHAACMHVQGVGVAP